MPTSSGSPALPLLVVELPAPVGREAAWNDWYVREHIPDMLSTVDGALTCTRYRVADSDDPNAFVVQYEFSSVDAVLAYQRSGLVVARGAEYEKLWGAPPEFRRRVLDPMFSTKA